jgi:hypothetical protein
MMPRISQNKLRAVGYMRYHINTKLLMQRT